MSPKAEEVIATLGGEQVVGPLTSRLDLDAALRVGLPVGSFETLAESLGVPQSILARALMIQPRTLSRRKRSGRLEATESDRLYRLARVFAHAIDVFGQMSHAAEWMSEPNRALAGRKPLDLLATDLGTREVDEALGRLEHGIFA